MYIAIEYMNIQDFHNLKVKKHWAGHWFILKIYLRLPSVK